MMPLSLQSVNAESSLEGRNLWLLHNGPKRIRFCSLKCLRNCVHIFKVGTTTGFDVYFVAEIGKGEHVKASSEDE